MAGVAVAGVTAQWIGWRFRVPSILALLAFGFVLGPATGWVKPSAILGSAMPSGIGMAVAIIVGGEEQLNKLSKPRRVIEIWCRPAAISHVVA